MFRRLRFTTLATTTWALLILSHNAEAFCGNSKGCSSKIRVQAFRFQNHDARSIAVRSEGIEEDFQGKFGQPFVGVAAETALSKVLRRFPSVISFDKKRFAKIGVAFALTYSIISNINGSISLSLAWYIASKQTGLSPLAPGQWKSLLAAYGGLYVFVTLIRPLRAALAVALTKNTEEFLEQTKERLGCSRATAIGLTVSLGLLLWITSAAGGVALASTLSGVPIWKF